MQASRWYFGGALLGVLVLGSVILFVHQIHSPSTQNGNTVESSSATVDEFTQSTSSGVINPKAIPE